MKGTFVRFEHVGATYIGMVVRHPRQMGPKVTISGTIRVGFIHPLNGFMELWVRKGEMTGFPPAKDEVVQLLTKELMVRGLLE